ncbi:hypothetical protein [Flavobacterium sp. H122]|uniref:hypothetical protein n=1 Tax=Flavobacterium sp. H122 TaxID=2529860 RepID=UPI0010A9ECF1|nr:hypothetical protein [Flavobacterium sp. H122]
MIHTYNYADTSNALKELQEMGFIYDYNIHHDEFLKNPHDFEIVHIFRYEGDSSADDESTVYGIRSKSNHDKKGIFVSGFSANSECESTRFLIGLTIKGRKGL